MKVKNISTAAYSIAFFKKTSNSILIFAASFLAFLSPITDADLGWHLRYGDYFWQNSRILNQNIFSWSMPDFQWVNHSWGYDLLTSFIFNTFGFLGLSVLGALIIATAFTLALSLISKGAFQVMALIFAIFITFPLLHTGLKSQHFSLLATAILWWLLETKIYVKYRFSLPLLFLIWANIHGQFVLGLAFLWAYILGQGISLWWKWIQETITNKQLLQLRLKILHSAFIAGISSLITFINPYGYSLHLDLLSYTDSKLLDQVTEWQPWQFDGLPPYMLVAYTLLLTWTAYKTFSKYTSQWTVIFLLGYLAFSARRIIPIYILASLPLLSMAAPQLIQKLQKVGTKKFSLPNLILSICVLIFLFKVITLKELWSQNWEAYCNSEIQCSEPVITFLKQNNIQGKIFNAYRLGGHLIYRYPEQPIFIDGRMTLWRDQNKQAPFDQYWNIVHTLPAGKDQFYQLNPDYVLVNHQYKLAEALKNYEHWPIIYQDQKVVLFQNPHN